MVNGVPLAQWLRGQGFTENPFALCEAGREGRLSEYFVEGPHYDEIKGSAGDPKTSFVFAARGCGKSAYRVMIQSACRPDERDSTILAIPYVRFDQVLAEANGALSEVTRDHHLRAILAASLITLLREFAKDPQGFLKLPRTRQRLLRSLIDQYAPSLLDLAFLSDHLRGWGEEDLADLIENASEQALPEVLLGCASLPLCRVIHTLLSASPGSLPRGLSIADHWRALVALAQQVGLQAVYVLVDGLDEFPEAIIGKDLAVDQFLLPLIADLALMEMPAVAFKFFLPLEVFESLQENPAVRFGRLRWYHLQWKESHLMRMLQTRLQAFSGGHIASLDAIASVDAAGQIDGQLVRWCHGSPRRLMLLGDLLFTLHCDQSSGAGSLLTQADLQKVPNHFRQKYGTLAPLLSIDESRHRISIGGRPIQEKLSSLEYQLLQYLYRNAGVMKSKDDIYLAVYGTSEGVSNEAIDSLVFRLRRKIEPDSKRPMYLLSRRGQGYWLTNVE